MRPTGCVNFTLNVGMRFSQQRKQNLKRESWLFFLKCTLTKKSGHSSFRFLLCKGGRDADWRRHFPVWSSANLAAYCVNLCSCLFRWMLYLCLCNLGMIFIFKTLCIAYPLCHALRDQGDTALENFYL